MTRATLWVILGTGLALGMAVYTEGLICYRCAKVRGDTVADANLKCLENSREIRCANEEDRCFSLASGPDENEVEKDCARSTDCVGRICCNSDFCNAGFGITSQRGSGKECTAISDCVQTRGEMVCDPGQPSELTKRCLCTSSTVNFGAICRQAFVGEWCDVTSQCKDDNSRCTGSQCVCESSFFSNETICIAKRSIGEGCLEDRHCGVEKSVCNGTTCVCPQAFPFSNSSNTCSGGQPRCILNHHSPLPSAVFLVYLAMVAINGLVSV